LAYRQLEGVGDSTQEWNENPNNYAHHLRRRLTVEEQVLVGEAVDCRRTAEAYKRFRDIKNQLPERMQKFAEKEISS